MRILLFVFIFCVIPFRGVFSQEKFFIGSKENYVIQLESDVVLKSRNNSDGGLVDQYNGKLNEESIYILTITEVNSLDTLVIDEDFHAIFLNTCSCIVLDKESKKFANVEGLQMQVESKKFTERIISGFSFVMMTKRGKIFMISFLVQKEMLESGKAKFYSIMDRIMFNE